MVRPTSNRRSFRRKNHSKMLASLLFFMAVSDPVLSNAGFEDPNPLSGWRVYVENREGKDPVIRTDSREFKEGNQSLLLAPEDPAELTIGQRLYLPVGSL